MSVVRHVSLLQNLNQSIVKENGNMAADSKMSEQRNQNINFGGFKAKQTGSGIPDTSSDCLEIARGGNWSLKLGGSEGADWKEPSFCCAICC
jgi:hypothetical protein